MSTLRIVHVADDPRDTELIARQLSRDANGIDVLRVESAASLRDALAGEKACDVVLSDDATPGFSAAAALGIVNELAPDVPFILVSDNIGDEQAGELIRRGAVDYVWKDRLGRLRSSIERAVAERADRRLRTQSEERFRLAVDHQLDGFVISSPMYDEKGEIVDFAFDFINRAACRLIGFSIERDVGRGMRAVLPEAVAPVVVEAMVKVVATGEPLVLDDMAARSLDEARRRLFFDVRIVKHDDGCVVSFSDVSDRHAAQERARVVTQLYATLSAVNEAIVVATDRPTLYRALCEAAVEHAHTALAWVGEADEETGAVRLMAVAGDRADFLDGIVITVRADEPSGRGPAGTAIREGAHVLIPDIAADSRLAPWRDRARDYGFESAAAFPLLCRDRVVGALMLYGTEPRFLHDEEIELLDQLAADVSFALDSLDREARRREAEADLERAAALLAEGEEVAGFGCWEWDPGRNELTWSEGFGTILGLDPDVEPSRDALERAIGRSQLAAIQRGKPDSLEALRRGETVSIEHRFEFAGEHRLIAIAARPVFGLGGALDRVVGTVQDITARRRAEQDLWLHSRLLDTVHAGVIATDMQSRIIYWNAGAAELYGWSRDEAIGFSIDDLTVGPQDDTVAAEILDAIRERGAWEGMFETSRKDGTIFPALVHEVVFRDEQGEPQGIIGVSVDISDRVAAERDLKEARDFLGAVTESMGEGLLTLDADARISYVNQAGLQLLGWGADELVGRPACDAILTGCDGPHLPMLCSAKPVGGPIRVRDEAFVRHDGSALPVAFTASPMHGGDGWVVVFSDDSERRAERERLERELEALGWVGRIRSALQGDDLVLYAQPIVDVASGAVCQHELLVRMRGAGGSVIPPSAFLSIAERYGLIKDIDRWVIEHGIEFAKHGHPVEINLSAASLGDRDVAAWLEEQVRASGVDPGMLVFEVTETALLSDEAAGEAFAARLAALGCGLALDDFGTGYGGFTYLKRLDVDALKVDIEFVRDLPVNPASRHVVTAVVSLAKAFGLTTIAEGVEDADTLALLREMGVDQAQGYFTGRPALATTFFDQELELAR